jgi:aerobic-type carbon monoxide dehydrogenase small subunit (CoxS/CutS family)
MKKREISLHVNGELHTLNVAANTTLLQALREDLSFTETKYGCGTGECGACTVLVDGAKAILSCMTLAATMDGKHITTAAGLARDGKLHPVQQAFVDESGIQCGYCTPGMVLKTVSILARNPNPSEAQIRHGLEGNICRCTGYAKIVKSVQRAAELMADETKAAE